MEWRGALSCACFVDRMLSAVLLSIINWELENNKIQVTAVLLLYLPNVATSNIF